MPYNTRRLFSGKVRVTGPSGVHAKGTTPTKAKAQVRLLNAIEHGFKPTGAKKSKKKNPKQTKKVNPVLSAAGKKGHMIKRMKNIMKDRK